MDVIEYTNGSDTTYTITGTPEEVDQKIAALLLRWHPAGYGTRLERKTTNEAGETTAVVTRWNSCD